MVGTHLLYNYLALPSAFAHQVRRSHWSHSLAKVCFRNPGQSCEMEVHVQVADNVSKSFLSCPPLDHGCCSTLSSLPITVGVHLLLYHASTYDLSLNQLLCLFSYAIFPPLTSCVKMAGVSRIGKQSCPVLTCPREINFKSNEICSRNNNRTC
ncbi:hypothetical protein GGR53DRAFT_506186 [Hypoxylon sp. FL1150]|nr:hypothetical protein GGR53DRAFT_506186 [Hypoxylon sp. FL1150]